MDAAWTMGQTAHMRCLGNVAGIRVGPQIANPRSGDNQTMLQDLAEAAARLAHGDFDSVRMTAPMAAAAAADSSHVLAEALRTLLHSDRAKHRRGLVRSFGGARHLLRKREERVGPKPSAAVYLSVMCGVSGDGLVFRAMGGREENMHFFEVCPEHIKTLRKVFPQANICPGDIMTDTVQTALLALRGTVDIAVLAMLCQASSKAATKHDAADPRLAVGQKALELVLAVRPAVFIAENVYSFAEMQPAAYKEAQDAVAKVYEHRDTVLINAKHTMGATQRNRMIMVASLLGPVAELRRAVKTQTDLRLAGVATCPTPRQALSGYLDLHEFDAVLIPHLRGAARGADGKPRRTASLDNEVMVTVTGNFGKAGCITPRHCAQYKGCDADVADLKRTLCMPRWGWGVINMFPSNYPFSDAAHCGCAGCVRPGGRKSSSRHVGDVQIGNVFVTGTALFVHKHAVRWVVGRPTKTHQRPRTKALGTLLAGGAGHSEIPNAEGENDTNDSDTEYVPASEDESGEEESSESEGENKEEQEAQESKGQTGDTHQFGGDPRHNLRACSGEMVTPLWEMEGRGLTCPCCNGSVEVRPERGAAFLAKLLRCDAYAALGAVTDDEATRRLRTAHQRMGHATINTLRNMHQAGAELGLKGLSEAQLHCKEMLCSTCRRTRQQRRSHKRNTRKTRKNPIELGLLEEVMVDLDGPYPPSLLTKGGIRAPQLRGGANKYAVLYVDRSTERIFPSFVRSKDQVPLLENVKTTSAHMTIEARRSPEWDGTNDIKVKTFLSDRESSLTSKMAVSYMLSEKIKHKMTAVDSKQQTAILDNLMRRVQNVARSLLDQAGLGIEYWELAYVVAAELVNLMPTASHPDGHCAMQRWTGEAPDVSVVRTFGSDVYPYQEVNSGQRGSKLEPMAPGGDGRFRLMHWTAQGPGVESMGANIIDTKTGQCRAMRNFRLNEDMQAVQQYEQPVSMWGKDSAPVDLPMDVERADETDNEDDSSDSDEETVVDLPMGAAESKEGVDDDSDDTEEPAPQTPLTQRGSKPKLGPEQLMAVRQNNPKQEGSKSWKRYNRYKAARSVAEYHQLGGTSQDLRWDLDHGFINLHPSVAWTAGWIRDPRCEQLSRSHRSGHVQGSAGKRERATAMYEAMNATFHAQRRAAGVEVPTGADESVRNMPFWEVNSDFKERAHVHLGRLQSVAREDVMWEQELRGVKEKARSAPGFRDGTWRTRSEGAGDAEGNQASASAFQPELITGFRDTLANYAGEVYAEMLEEYEAHMGHGLPKLTKRASTFATPRNFKAAMKGEFAAYWKEAIQTEIDVLKEHEVFTWVPRPPSRKLIDSTWAWKVKPDELGYVSRFRARLAARGFKQIYGVDYVDSMAPVAKLSTFRVLLAESARRGMDIDFVDIRSAYLQAKLKIKQYMKPPEGVPPPKPGMVMRLDRALPGTTQAGREWHKQIHGKMIGWGFKVSAADPCLYVKWSKDGQTVQRVLLFVDDLAIFTDSTEEGRRMRKDLTDAISKAGYKYSQDDAADHYLGMRVQRVGGKQTTIFLSQTRYLEDIKIKFGYSEEPFKEVHRPAMAGKVSALDCWGHTAETRATGGLVPAGVNPKHNKDGTRYREMCGVLRWVEQCTRPDISATLSELCKVQINPGMDHVRRMDHLMRYVFTTMNLGLLYGGPKRETASGVLVGYCDSDWSGDYLVDGSSRGGHLMTCWQTPVSWASFKLKAVAASSCEAEYMAASQLAREARWMRYLLSDLGYGDLRVTDYGKFCDKDYAKVRMSDLVDRKERPIMCCGDNKGANAITENPVLHRRTKHIHIRYHLVRAEVQKGHLTFVYINTKENIADLLTKGLVRVTHRYLVDKIMNVVDKHGVVRNTKGDEIAMVEADPARDKVYTHKPKGLFPPWKDEQPWSKGADPSNCGEIPAGGVAVSDGAVEQDLTKALQLASTTDSQTLQDVACECFLAMVMDGSIQVGGSVAMCLSRAMAVRAITQAIVDSGASYTYVAGGTRLRNATPGQGAVRVANGQVERVHKEGDLGPLVGVKEVKSFSRTLVSVTDLVEQFGRVVFDSEGVRVQTQGAQKGRPQESTLIGRPTANRLYSFDLEALQRHADKLVESHVGMAVAAFAMAA